MAESKTRGRLREFVATGALPLAASEASPAGAADLLAAAREQGLAGVLLAALERQGPSAAALVEPLRAERRRQLAVSLRQVALAARACGVLERAGIRALPLKGAVLAETVYDLESERPMADVDLLALERWRDGAEVLRADGLQPLAAADHARVLVERDSGLLLELHRSPTSAPGLFPLDAEGLWSRRRAGHRQLKALPSVEGLLQREPVEPTRLLALAGAARAGSALAAALLAAEAVAGAPLPAALAATLPSELPAGLRRWLAPRLAAPLSLVAPRTPPLGRVRWELLHGRRLELLWRTLVLPETPGGDARLAPRAAQAAARLARLGSGALASLTGLRRGD